CPRDRLITNYRSNSRTVANLRTHRASCMWPALPDDRGKRQGSVPRGRDYADVQVFLGGAGVLDDQLGRYHAVPVVLLQPVGDVDLFRNPVCMVEPDGVEALVAALETELQMLVL